MYDTGGTPNTSDIVDVIESTPVPNPNSASLVPSADTRSQTVQSPHPTPISDAIRCVCEDEEDDGFTIQCESCLVWQHAGCVGINKDSVPEQYFCEKCQPDWHISVENFQQPTKKRKAAGPRSALSSSTTMTGEISRNIIGKISHLVEPFLQQYELILSKMPKPYKGVQDYFKVNYEMARNFVSLPSQDILDLIIRNIEVREVKIRGYQRKANISSLHTYSAVSSAFSAMSTGQTRLGVFSMEPIDPGVMIVEFIGHLQPISALGTRTESVLQSQVLWSRQLPIVVDSRRFGNISRYIRRSCRPNCEIKVVLTGSKSPSDLHFVIFSSSSIFPGDELFLPIDYVDGNSLFKYECACGNSDLCLAMDIATVPVISNINSITNPIAAATIAITTATAANPISTNASNSTNNLASRNKASSLDMRNGSVSSLGMLSSTKADRKLTREERKLQQYIEFFEKMENAERKHSIRKSQSHSGSSGAGTPSPKSSSPKKSTSISSPVKEERKVLGAAQPRTVYSPKSSKEASPVASVSSSGEETISPVTFFKKRLVKSLQSKQKHADFAKSMTNDSPMVHPFEQEDSKTIVKDETMVDIESINLDLSNEESMVPNSQYQPSSLATTATVGTTATTTVTNTINTTTAAAITTVNNTQVPQENLRATPLSQIIQESSISNRSGIKEIDAQSPDTPSKKRLSLSDYLRKKKTSPGEAQFSRADSNLDHVHDYDDKLHHDNPQYDDHKPSEYKRSISTHQDKYNQNESCSIKEFATKKARTKHDFEEKDFNHMNPHLPSYDAANSSQDQKFYPSQPREYNNYDERKRRDISRGNGSDEDNRFNKSIGNKFLPYLHDQSLKTGSQNYGQHERTGQDFPGRHGNANNNFWADRRMDHYIHPTNSGYGYGKYDEINNYRSEDGSFPPRMYSSSSSSSSSTPPSTAPPLPPVSDFRRPGSSNSYGNNTMGSGSTPVIGGSAYKPNNGDYARREGGNTSNSSNSGYTDNQYGDKNTLTSSGGGFSRERGNGGNYYSTEPDYHYGHQYHHSHYDHHSHKPNSKHVDNPANNINFNQQNYAYTGSASTPPSLSRQPQSRQVPPHLPPPPPHS